MGPAALIPLRRKWCYGFLLPFKIDRSRPGLNPRNMGLMASMITITSRRTTAEMLSIIQIKIKATKQNELEHIAIQFKLFPQLLSVV
jgi:hypothetical protein